MFDLDWSKLALIAVVALVVIGPKDLPRVMRIIGQWVQRARSIARDFQGSLDQMVRESELEEVKRNLDKVATFDVEHEIGQTIDPGGALQRSLSDPALTNPLLDAPKSAGEEKSDAVTEAAGSEKPVEALPPSAEPMALDAGTAKPTVSASEPETHRG
jgi:sec-independent protein translocase protein TatB